MEKLLFIGLILFGGWLLLRRSPRKPLLDETEARAILGVGPAADAEAIRAAHRRLVSAVHPDRGGSADLTRRINTARDVLLRRSE
jgi:DnaJ homolog subfamily C member 19